MKSLKEIIKEQHGILDNTIKQLESIIIDREDSKFDLKESITNLINFLKIHFYTENLLINELNLSNKEEHVNDHLKLINYLSENNDVIESLIYIKKWEKNHRNIFDSFIL